MSTRLTLDFETWDAGGTMVVTVSLGEYEIGRYLPGTRYDDVAIQEVQKVFATALGDLVRPRLEGRGVVEYEEGIL